MKDPYSVLGVAKDATQEDIKKAYRNLVKKNHPDLNPGNKQAEARFKDISVAYEQIGTPEARAKFDRGETDDQKQEQYERQQKYWEEAFRHAGQRRSSYYNTQQEGGRYSQNFGEEFGTEDFFEELFRSARRKKTPEKGQDTLYQMEVSLYDSVVGTEKVITLPNGKSISVKIPAGINSGTKLRFKGLGEAGPGNAPAGDAYIEVIVTPMKGFKKVGDDIEVEVNVSFIEALLGGEISVPTLLGPVKLKLPQGISTGNRLRIKGKGVQHPGNPGNQIVLLKIVMPKHVDPELVAAVKSWKGKFDYNPRAEDTGSKRNERSEKEHNV